MQSSLLLLPLLLFAAAIKAAPPPSPCRALSNAISAGAALRVEASLCEGGPRGAPTKQRCAVVWAANATYALDSARAADVRVAIPSSARVGGQPLSLRVAVFAATAAAGGKEYALVATSAAAVTTFAPRPQPTRLLLRESPPPAGAWRPDERFLHWRPRADVLLGVDSAAYASVEEMPAALRGTARERQCAYVPVLLTSFLGVRAEDFVELNATSAEQQSLSLRLRPMPPSRIVWLASVEASSSSSSSSSSKLSATAKEMDSVKAIFLETHPVLLWTVVGASFLHLLFDFLALKNDVSFWRGRKGDVRGISLGSIAANAVFRVVVFFYLLDNDASMLVLLPMALTGLVEVWKLTRAFKIERCSKAKLGFRFVLAQSYASGGTEEYDLKALRILSVVLVPAVVGYAGYSLWFVRHKGWYSWALSSATSVVYALGFVLMTPQLFINHKLKTVAHLPWRALVYRALNTFIDDLFAFVIHMPTMHRLSCFRDDIVFLIYLYQRWVYPVDHSRAPDGAAKSKDQ